MSTPKPAGTSDRAENKTSPAGPIVPTPSEAIVRSTEPHETDLDVLRSELDEARKALPKPDAQTYTQGLDADRPGTAFVALAQMSQDWMRFQVATVRYQDAFTRYMTALDKRSEERSFRQTRDIKWATVAMVFSPFAAALLEHCK